MLKIGQLIFNIKISNNERFLIVLFPISMNIRGEIKKHFYFPTMYLLLLKNKDVRIIDIIPAEMPVTIKLPYCRISNPTIYRKPIINIESTASRYIKL